MSSAFERLLSPLRLGSKTMPARIVFASHQTNLAAHNRFEERHAAYYEYAVFGYDENVVAGYRLVADA